MSRGIALRIFAHAFGPARRSRGSIIAVSAGTLCAIRRVTNTTLFRPPLIASSVCSMARAQSPRRGTALGAIGPEWNRLKTAGQNAIEPGNWPLLWATFVLIKLIHELGHAFSCRRFGGEVHELGIMFLVFVPAPYVDASSAWSLPSKWQRVFVGAGGMIFELFVAAICAFIWKYTDPTTLVSKLAYNAMFIATVTTILFNANPLLRYDGYYILSDLLEIPNLRQQSMENSMSLIKRHVFRVKRAE